MIFKFFVLSKDGQTKKYMFMHSYPVVATLQPPLRLSQVQLIGVLGGEGDGGS